MTDNSPEVERICELLDEKVVLFKQLAEKNAEIAKLQAEKEALSRYLALHKVKQEVTDDK